MNRKGITPVFAVVMLILVTIGGSALIYEVFNTTQNQAQSFDPDLNLDSDSLRIESCWNSSPTDLHLSIRNEASESVNVSGIPFRIEGEDLIRGENITFSNFVVDPQSTFDVRLENTQAFNSETRIDILTAEETIEYRCNRLPDP